MNVQLCSHAHITVDRLRGRIDIQLESFNQAIVMTSSGEISLIERNETLERESNDLNRIDYVSKVKRNVFPCLVEERIMESTMSKEKCTTESDGNAVNLIKSFQDISIFRNNCMMHEDNLEGSFQGDRELWFHILVHGSIRISVLDFLCSSGNMIPHDKFFDGIFPISEHHCFVRGLSDS